MKFTIERSTLLKLLTHVQNVVEKRQTIPILSNIKIDVVKDLEGERVTIKATDMDLEVIESAAAKVEDGGSVTASAHKLLEIARKLPEGAEVEIALDAKTSQLKISSGRTKFQLATLPGDEFPSISEGSMPINFTLTAAELSSLFDRTLFAVSQEETRYYLNGIYMHEKGEGKDAVLKAAATDGHRLATAEVSLPEGAKGMAGIIVPKKTVGEVQKLVAELLEDVKISINPNKIRFEIADLILTSKLIDGTYPDYERVIPTGNDKFAEVDSDALANAVDCVAVICEKSKGVKLKIAKNKVAVTASSADEGSAETDVEAEYEGETIEIGFNFRYLLDILGQTKGAKVKLAMLDASSPVIVTDMSDDAVTYVIMPMRV